MEGGLRQVLPVWLGPPTSPADTPAPSWLCALWDGLCVLLCQGQLPVRAHGIRLRVAFCKQG